MPYIDKFKNGKTSWLTDAGTGIVDAVKPVVNTIGALQSDPYADTEEQSQIIHDNLFGKDPEAPPAPDPNDEYEKNIAVPRLIKQRDQEYKTLQQAYVGTIKGDTWETAIGLDTIAQKNLQNFRDRWDKIMEEKKFTSYDYSSDYGGFSPLYDSGFKSLTNMGNTGNKSGYLGG